MEILLQTAYQPPSGKIRRSDFRAALPSEWVHLCKDESLAKIGARLRAHLPKELDREYNLTGKQRESGEQWSVITCPVTTVDVAAGHAQAYSIRLTKTSDIIGDYERPSVPLGQAVITEHGAIRGSGSGFVVAAVGASAQAVDGLISKRDLLDSFKAGLAELCAVPQAKSSWFIQPQHQQRLTSLIEAYNRLGASMSIVTMGVNLGDNPAAIVKALGGYVRSFKRESIERLQEGERQSEALAKGERKKALAKPAFVKMQIEAQRIVNQISEIQQVFEREAITTSFAFNVIKANVKAIQSSAQNFELADKSDRIVLGQRITQIADEVCPAPDPAPEPAPESAPEPAPETETENTTAQPTEVDSAFLQQLAERLAASKKDSGE